MLRNIDATLDWYYKPWASRPTEVITAKFQFIEPTFAGDMVRWEVGLIYEEFDDFLTDVQEFYQRAMHEFMDGDVQFLGKEIDNGD